MSASQGLGRLQDLHRFLQERNCAARNYSLVLFAADHGVSKENTSIYYAMQSHAIVEEHLRGESAVTRLLHRLNSREYIINIGLAQEPDFTGLADFKKECVYGTEVKAQTTTSCYFSVPVSKGSRNFLYGDALTKDEVNRAADTGKQFCDCLCRGDVDIFAIGEIGIANTLCAAALAAAITGLDPLLLTGRGSADNQVISRKLDIIGRAMVLRKPCAGDPVDILARFGGLEIAALTGFILRAAEIGIPVMLDGYVTTIAALTASLYKPQIIANVFAPSLSDQTGHELILNQLGLKPLFDLDINYGEGLAAVIGLFMAEITEIFYN
ncbi:nicotinate-nucleotide--dimethylbenzimidazole phosphoribosyltransferase [Syntrophomonas palmitatica]|uniref:nicotinate-nucleotide--dimethylbenzimidazole phosphoribosyltransferase n=1 Tax=Syntrophomonas palmitatica TaxID=402877 RepID=UPI0006CF44EA|nr:nicotinate-nucleotide--dimethylbenzimidazole phosphoribosyltransferase [Syntrophomonas palmitatica]